MPVFLQRLSAIAFGPAVNKRRGFTSLSHTFLTRGPLRFVFSSSTFVNLVSRAEIDPFAVLLPARTAEGVWRVNLRKAVAKCCELEKPRAMATLVTGCFSTLNR